MIRVNLIPRKRESKREGSRAWMFIAAALLMVEIIGIVVVHANKKSVLTKKNDDNTQLDSAIADKKRKVANHEAVKKELAEFQAREDAINLLQAGRVGPTAMLLELSRVLTPRKMPTVDPTILERTRRDNPGAMPSEKWDPHRLWLMSFSEQNQPGPAPAAAPPQPGAPAGPPPRVVAITGVARTSDDVAELIRRLQLSRYFQNVQLLSVADQTTKDDKSGATINTASFNLRAAMRY